jgi:hypothetical protein
MPHAMNHLEKAKISQELVTMGFGIDLAQKAVENMHGRSLEAALDWLTESAPQAPIAGRASQADIEHVMLAAAVDQSIDDDEELVRRSWMSFSAASKVGVAASAEPEPTELPPAAPAAFVADATEAVTRRRLLQLQQVTNPMAIAKAAVLLRRRANSIRRGSSIRRASSIRRTESMRASVGIPEEHAALAPPSVGQLEPSGAPMEPPPNVEGLPAREAAIVLGKHLLGQRLKALRLEQISVSDDGACQFRGFSQHLYGSQEYHLSIRHAVVEHMARESAYYGLMFDEDEFEPYLAGMRRSNTWGDELTLRAFADAYTVFVHVITSTGDHWHLQYPPAGGAPPKRHVFLSYTSPVHYDAITASAPLDDSQQPAVLAQALATSPPSALSPKTLKEAREDVYVEVGYELKVFKFEQGKLGIEFSGKIVGDAAILKVVGVLPDTQAAKLGVPVGSIMKLVGKNDVTTMTSLDEVTNVIATEPLQYEVTMTVPLQKEETTGTGGGAAAAAAPSPMGSPTSPTSLTGSPTGSAAQGINMLKRGTTALKFGRQGRPHPAIFRLSDDEAVLSWEDGRSGITGSLSNLAGSALGKKRSVRIAECAMLLVGAESEVFRRSYEGDSSDSSLCFSLLIDDGSSRSHEADSSGHAALNKDTLDVRCTDDVSFAHWVAALNVLLADAANAAAGGMGAEQERRARSLARSAPRLHKELLDRETAAEAELKAQAEAEAARWLANVDRRAQLTSPGFTL